MRYRSGSHFRDAIEAHVRAIWRGTKSSSERLRKEKVFDRLLARLLQVAPDRWVLKGGLALDHRLGDRARTTKDMDLGRRDDIDAATSDLQRAAARDLDDYFSFAIQLTSDLPELLEEGVAARYHAAALLGGRVFEKVIVDVGFDAPAPEQVDLVTGRDLLSFAGIAAVPIPTLPLPLHVAEKVHAYTGVYGRSRHASTRVKDLIDLALIATSSTLGSGALTDALAETFAQRATHPIPNTLPTPPRDYWPAAYATMAAQVGLDTAVDVGHALAAACLDPILTGQCPRGWTWNPEEEQWGLPDYRVA
jgi:hypothetical protein